MASLIAEDRESKHHPPEILYKPSN